MTLYCASCRQPAEVVQVIQDGYMTHYILKCTNTKFCDHTYTRTTKLATSLFEKDEKPHFLSRPPSEHILKDKS